MHDPCPGRAPCLMVHAIVAHLGAELLRHDVVPEALHRGHSGAHRHAARHGLGPSVAHGIQRRAHRAKHLLHLAQHRPVRQTQHRPLRKRPRERGRLGTSRSSTRHRLSGALTATHLNGIRAANKGRKMEAAHLDHQHTLQHGAYAACRKQHILLRDLDVQLPHWRQPLHACTLTTCDAHTADHDDRGPGAQCGS